MNYDPELAALLSQPWSNNACRGYVIYAMENCGFSPQDIRRVVAELYEVFDIRGLEEAQQLSLIHIYWEATAYYIHLLPERLVKSAGIDWEAMNRLIPRVELWEK